MQIISENEIRFTEICRGFTTEVVGGKTTNTMIELAMYSTKIRYFAGPIVHKGKPIRDNVELESYGLLVWEIKEVDGEITKGEPIDMGVQSAYPRHVNSFIHSMCRRTSVTLEAIKVALEEEIPLWADGWADPFAEEASKRLTRKLFPPNPTKLTGLIQTNHSKRTRRDNPFRSLPVYSASVGGYEL